MRKKLKKRRQRGSNPRPRGREAHVQTTRPLDPLVDNEGKYIMATTGTRHDNPRDGETGGLRNPEIGGGNPDAVQAEGLKWRFWR